MPPKKTSSLPSHILIGNCKVAVEAKNFKLESNQSNLEICLSRNAKINISVIEDTCKNGRNDHSQKHLNSEDKCSTCYFVLVNPKDGDAESKSMLLEVLNIYREELPTMNYAANTGKHSKFLERCVFNGKYCTLLLKYRSEEGPGEVIAAITYQIISADTQYAEVPLAAVRSIYKKKGVGQLMYMDLRRRLQSVGIRSIYCWGDKVSEGFWFKQGFASVGEVNIRGRARRLPIKADIRKALCFPGGSTLMVSHLTNENPVSYTDSVKLFFPLQPLQNLTPSPAVQNQEVESIIKSSDPPIEINQKISGTADFRPNETGKDNFLMDGCRNLLKTGHLVNDLEIPSHEVDGENSSVLGSRKRTWEASCTSLQSKKVKGSYLKSCQSNSLNHVSEIDGTNDFCLERSSQAFSRNKPLENITVRDPSSVSILEMNQQENRLCNTTAEHNVCEEVMPRKERFKIMLMNIADDAKKSNLSKIIKDLGGTVTSDGGSTTHVITGKVRKTLNFCTTLCSGAWIISPRWLKESFRKGSFVDEVPFILKDDEYELKYATELKSAIVRARMNPRGLLKSYDVCLAAHVQPPVSTLSTIVRIAGGNVICDINKVKIPKKTIFVASEDDMEEALSAMKMGIWTFSNDRFMNCIMRQELDFDAPQFAQSLKFLP